APAPPARGPLGARDGDGDRGGPRDDRRALPERRDRRRRARYGVRAAVLAPARAGPALGVRRLAGRPVRAARGRGAAPARRGPRRSSPTAAGRCMRPTRHPPRCGGGSGKPCAPCSFGGMSPPVIGLCTALERARWSVWDQQAFLLPRSYIDAVQRAGGVALMLPPDEHAIGDPDVLLDLLDGLILAGGADIDPGAYGSEAH